MVADQKKELWDALSLEEKLQLLNDFVLTDKPKVVVTNVMLDEPVHNTKVVTNYTEGQGWLLNMGQVGNALILMEDGTVQTVTSRCYRITSESMAELMYK